MVSPGPKIKLTYEDYAKTPDDERYELIDGELLMVPSPNRPHQWTVIHLGTRLIAFVEENDLGEVYFAPFDVVLSDTNVVQPDLVFVSRERLGIITHANIQGAPDLVVEVRSPSTAYRDLTIKRRLYAEHGVKEYWMVDPEARTSDGPAAEEWRPRGSGDLPEGSGLEFAHPGRLYPQPG